MKKLISQLYWRELNGRKSVELLFRSGGASTLNKEKRKLSLATELMF